MTARRGEALDRANAVASNPADPGTSSASRAPEPDEPGADLFDPSPYLAGTSDIVALMTFEHQTQMTNLMTRVGWDARIEAYPGSRDQGGGSTLDADVEDLVAYMLFAGEAPLKDPIEGVSSFARTFPGRGPRDSRGRSLRDFDLRTRLFKYPLSYMIYSPAFDALPGAVRLRIYRRLHEILSGADTSARYDYLSKATRRAILEILLGTKPNLPAEWRANR